VKLLVYLYTLLLTVHSVWNFLRSRSLSPVSFMFFFSAFIQSLGVRCQSSSQVVYPRSLAYFSPNGSHHSLFWPGCSLFFENRTREDTKRCNYRWPGMRTFSRSRAVASTLENFCFAAHEYLEMNRLAPRSKHSLQLPISLHFIHLLAAPSWK
jgi:hypothetical protein